MSKYTKIAVVMVFVLIQGAIASPLFAGIDVQVNDPTTDNIAGDDSTQSETTISYGNGVLCAGFNDFGPNGLSGWARSTDFGTNWTDLGGINESGDPVIVHHGASDTFYYASLGNTTPRINASTDGCLNWGAGISVTTAGAERKLPTTRDPSDTPRGGSRSAQGTVR